MSEELKPVAAGSGFDAEEPNTRGVLALTGGLVAMFIVVVVGVTYYFNHAYEREEYKQLLSRPSEELGVLRAREQWNQTHYGYLDKGKGQVRLPIDRAMALLVKEAAEGKLKYSTADQAPKKPEPVQQAAAGAPPPAGAGK